MSKLPIKDMEGNAAGDYELSADLLIYDKGSQAVQDAVVAFLANQRQGSAQTKERNAVRGSRAKPWKQKGTGRARAGSKQSPIWRGGGTVFGPHPRSYRKTMTKKALKLAFRRAFSEKVAAEQITVLSELTLAEAKTKLFQTLLNKLDLDRGALFVVDQASTELILASRNIPRVEIVAAKDVNVYQLLRYQQVVVTREAMAALEARLQAEVKRGEEA